MEKKLKTTVIVVLISIVLCLTLVLALVWSMPDLPTTEQRNQICLSSEFGSLKCGKTTDLLVDFLEKTIGKQYEEAKRKDKEKQQAYLSKNSARLMNIYDKHFWEMKPAAKLTGKEQPPLRETLVWTMPDIAKTEQRDQICLPSEFRTGPLKCGKTTDLLHDYLEKIVSNLYDEAKREDTEKQQVYLKQNRARLMTINDKHFWEMKPCAKVTGKEQPPLRKTDDIADMVPITEWRHGREDTDSFIRQGIRYRNGRLVVPVDGTYYIYSNLDFFEESNPSSGLPNIKDINKPIKHGIFKFNILEGEEKELVTNVQPHTISTNRYYNSYNSYVSALAELKAGDELSVKVSNITYIRYTPDNYFGVNLI